MQDRIQKLTLDQSAIYQIKVPGCLDESWKDWVEGIKITNETGEDLAPITTLTASLDQAGLHGLLRRLYALGMPLISIVCIEVC
ncbi:MAG: hypothetical protein JXB38_13125 [Anaerolineales bacterium]|nr:hypothetical protein [Anaerolineales bacterium]